MIFFGEMGFFLVLLICSLPAIVSGLCGKSVRLYALAVSAFLIWLGYGGSEGALLCFAAFLFVSLHVVKLYALLRRKWGRNPYIYGHAVFLALLPLVLSKVSGAAGVGTFGFMGISYVTFKVLQIIIEMYDGVIEDISARDYLLFLVFFPTLSSGPIDRSRRFQMDAERPLPGCEYADLLGEGLFKMVLGLVYKFVFSAFFMKLMTTYFAGKATVWAAAGYAYTYGFYLFFDFAGYSLMAVGTSYLFGIKTPDNFNKPFLSVDMRDFWDRWHITLSHWFRDYVFSRFMMDSIRKKRFKNKLNGACAGLILNMLLMGIWHGLSAAYIAYGLYHGVLLALTEIYHKKSKFYKRNKDRRLYKLVSWAVTLQLVMFGFLIFSGRLSAAVKLLINI